MKVRKSTRTMTSAEWDNFVCAYKAIHEGLLKGVEKPSLHDFVNEHAATMKDENHDWYVHTHGDFSRPHWADLPSRWTREVFSVTL
jgi:hypothetical protein